AFSNSRRPMEETLRYLERKYEELSLISSCLHRSGCSRPNSIEGVIEEKFRLAGQLRSEHALSAWQNTQTLWCKTPLRSGPYSFEYRYQRADLTVSGPSPYPDLGDIPGVQYRGPVYTCSGMAAVSALLLALSGRGNTAIVHLPGCYKETLELAATVPNLCCECFGSSKTFGSS